MVYRAIGLISSSNLDALDLVFTEFDVIGKKWTYEIKFTKRILYTDHWTAQFKKAEALSATAYMQLHADFGQFLGEQVNQFIQEHQLDYQVQLIGVHGHPAFYSPATKMSHRLGDGAAVASVTGINVVSDLQNMDIALGGDGSSLFSIAEKLLPATEQTGFKEALAVAFSALLRWREENNMLHADTGATRDSIGGAVWLGQEW